MGTVRRFGEGVIGEEEEKLGLGCKTDRWMDE